MISTSVDYRVVVKDYAASLKRTAKDPQVARDIAYYKENIGKIKSSADLMKDYRLYSYAMKAFGLEDMTYAKGFMKKVLASDLSDVNSFANKLTDTRYQKFAAAFSFSSGVKTAQSSAQEDDTIGLYSASIANENTQTASLSSYYTETMDSITRVDDFLNNSTLRTYALKAGNIDPSTPPDFLKNLLTSDLSDPKSYANQLPDQYQIGVDANNKPVFQSFPKRTYLNFAAQFNFQADGTVKVGGKAQTADQKKAITDSYTLHVPSHITPAAADLNIHYLKERMAKVTTVSDITKDTRLFDIVKTALGLDSSFLESTFENIVNSDLSDPNNYAKLLGGDTYIAIVKMFNFGTDSKILPGQPAQTEQQMQTLIAGYQEKYAVADGKQQAKDDTYYKTKIAGVKTVDNLLSDPGLYNYALKAYGIGSTEIPQYKIKDILTADRSKPGNYTDLQSDLRLKKLADAFNFDVSGKIATPKLAQDPSRTQQLSNEYTAQKTRFLTGNELKLAQAKAKDEVAYYASTIQKVKSVSDLLADKRLLTIALTSKGIDPAKVPSDYLKKIFASDLDKADSFANTETDTRFRDLAASFNFEPKGNIAPLKSVGGQSRAAFITTNSNYLQQSLELSAGEDNEGVRLALYFRRLAPSLGNAYDILADPALIKVFQTAFGLPASMSQVKVERQADMIKSRLDLKDFQDPAKLNKFIDRFVAMYDKENGDGGSSSSLALTLLGG